MHKTPVGRGAAPKKKYRYAENIPFGARGPRTPLFPKRIGLVAVDAWDIKAGNGVLSAEHAGFDGHISELIVACDREGCDTVLFSPWTLKSKITAKTDVFPPSTTHAAVILAVESDANLPETHQIWRRRNEYPTEVTQKFARCSDPDVCREAFMSEAHDRMWGDVALLVCGETNILKFRRVSKRVLDPWGFLPIVDEGNVRVILNPVHSYMRRYEMAHKRRALSRHGRWVVSVWNRGFANGGEARLPWQVFHNRKDVSGSVDPITTFERREFRAKVGVLDLRPGSSR